MPASSVGYLRSSFVEPSPAPTSETGAIGWMRANLFSSVASTVLTILAIAFVVWIVPSILKFLLVDAVWNGEDREACLSKNGVEVGACWAFVKARFAYFMYGQYPIEQRWRVDLTGILGVIGAVWMLWPRVPQKGIGALYFFVFLPIAAFILLSGANWLGLPTVPTNLWGGLLVTLVISTVGIVFSLPLGIALALGRRSKLPIVKFFSVVFIEFVRGVPLITVLFMANVMLPLFLPEGFRPDNLLRVLIGVALFSAAYMAETVRGGLQAMPKGQYEGAMALGLNYPQMMSLIILPQALKIVIPGIVNTFIGLFKDTSLVSIVGIFDMLKTVEVSLVDPKWATPVSRASGYAFAALIYFIFCFGMSRYSIWMEKRLSTGHKR
ncbi:amino acid ABC transporter permease [Terrarubrum flagellatum]|uniref:amino acid ABC transporter permease n=1 Tax=Terrirubrum flagellatum TaxID=2895980 RepID=UPI0031455244